MKSYKIYTRRVSRAELRPYRDGESLSESVSISERDLDAGCPKEGDMIRVDPATGRDLYLVSAKYFAENFDPNGADPC